MKVIVTGATGFVGQNLVPYLENAGMKLQPVSLRSEAWQAELNPKATALIHLAGKAHDTSNSSDPSAYFQVNYALTKEIFSHFLENDIQNFIYFSSVKAVADTVDGILDEDHEINPITPYGQSKQAAEEYIQSNPIPPGKRVFIIRPCMIHGPGNKGNLNLLYTLGSKGLPWPLGSFDNKRSFCSIENLCFAVCRMLEKREIPSGIYNLADDEPLSTNELIRLIAASQDRKPKILYLPKCLIKSLSRLGNVLGLPLNSERLQKLTESYIVDNTKIKHAIGKPFPVSARSGLLRTFQSFQNKDE